MSARDQVAPAMNALNSLEGLWRVVTYEENGIHRPAESVEQMGCLLILPARQVPDSDGTWGCIVFRVRLAADVLARSARSLLQLVAGLQHDRSTDFHIYTGGVFYLGETKSNFCRTIDFKVYHGTVTDAAIVEHQVNRGIYHCDGATLSLCLNDCRVKERPTLFDSTQTSGQSLAVYTRYQTVGESDF